MPKPNDPENRGLSFTAHGLSRAQARSSLSPEDLAELFLSDIALTIGTEKNRSHQLIYSVTEARHLVGVVDIKTREIVTVLPPDYHKNIAWVIRPVAFEYTRRKALGIPCEELLEINQPPPPAIKEPEIKKETTGPVKMRVVAVLKTPLNRDYKLGKFIFETRPETSEAALDNSAFRKDLGHKLRIKGVPMELLECVELIEGEKTPIIIPSKEGILMANKKWRKM